MVSAKVEATAKPGLDVNGNKIVFPMERQTAIAYFHFTSDNAEEDITKATLTVEGGSIAAGRALLAPSDFTPDLDSSPLSEIVLNVTGQKADDFSLWFNVLPTSYTKMTLTVETATKTFTISKNSEGTYEAGKLYKVKKDGIAWTDVEESIAECIFYESFDTNDGKGGNDGEWSGSIATNAFSSDNKGWTPGANAKGAYQCVKLGAGSAKGNITTPALGIPEGTNVTFKFMAAAWNGTDEKTGLNISIAEGCKGTITPGTITLKKGEWTIYENYIITGGDADTKVKIEAQEASKNRFFLDEVEVWTEGKIPASYNVNIAAADGGKISASKTRAPEGAEITLTATPDEGYEFIENSWKVVAADDSEITVTDGKFIMPASDVTVTASFVRKPYLNAVASKTTISADGETVTVTVDTNVDGGWTAESSDETNFTIGNKTATTFDVTVSKNETEAAREVTITVTAGTLSKTISLTQNGAGSSGKDPVVIILDAKDLTSTATTEDKEVTAEDVTFVLSKGAKQQKSSSATNAFSNNAAILIGKSGAYIYNKTAIPGVITKFEIYTNAGASNKVSIGVNFSSSSLSSYSATAANTYTSTLSKLNTVYDCTDKLPSDAKYFWYQVTNAYNSQVQFRITYIPE